MLCSTARAVCNSRWDGSAKHSPMRYCLHARVTADNALLSSLIDHVCTLCICTHAMHGASRVLCQREPSSADFIHLFALTLSGMRPFVARMLRVSIALKLRSYAMPVIDPKLENIDAESLTRRQSMCSPLALNASKSRCKTIMLLSQCSN